MTNYFSERKKVFIPIWCITLVGFAIFIGIGVYEDRNPDKKDYYAYLLNEKTKLYEPLKEEIQQSQAQSLNVLGFFLDKLENNQDRDKLNGGLSFSILKSNQAPKTANDEQVFKFVFKAPKDKSEYYDLTYEVPSKQESFVSEDKKITGFAFENYIPEVEYIANQENHLNYPFDKLNFNFPKIILPSGVTFQKIEFYNYTEYFVLDSAPEIKINEGESSLSLKFNLDRLNTVETVFWVIVVVLLLYVILVIFRINEINAVVSSMGAIIFSTWGLNSIFGQEAVSHPNILDLLSISVIILLLIGVSTKLIFGYYKNN